MRFFGKHATPRNRDFLFFIAGVLSLGLFGYLIRRTMRKSSTDKAFSGEFLLPEKAGQVPRYRLGDLEFRVDRQRKTVCAFHAETGERVWESHGEDRFIVPGAAFPIDLSDDGTLWAANVGRKRLEQLDPTTGVFIASWEPKQPFGGCCNPVRFAALAGGRFVTMEKGVRRVCIYWPSGDLERVVTDTLSDSEYQYYLLRDRDAVGGDTIHLYDTGSKQHWVVW